MHCHNMNDLRPVDMGRVSAVSILSAEHRVILQTLEVLEALAGKTKAGEPFAAGDAGDILTVLRQFADRCHHGKEEELLFPALESAVPGFGPVQVMRAEHVEGRAFIEGMVKAVAGGDGKAFAAHGLLYVDLLRQHIHKEDNILFPMAAELLSAEADGEVVEGYRRVEHADMGDGTHERLLAMADGLARKYGVAIASSDPATMKLLTAVCGCAV